MEKLRSADLETSGLEKLLENLKSAEAEWRGATSASEPEVKMIKLTRSKQSGNVRFEAVKNELNLVEKSFDVRRHENELNLLEEFFDVRRHENGWNLTEKQSTDPIYELQPYKITANRKAL